MSKTIIIDPITRISGFLEVKIEVDENIVVAAETSGLLFRGFETMLEGRPPFDAIYFTERICGICSTAHAAASTLALENALKVSIDINDMYIRNIMHGFEFLQNHIRQFYLYTIPSYVKFLDLKPVFPQGHNDFRLPESLNARICKNYIKSIELSRLAHEGIAVLGGKAPHNHGFFVGGVTVRIDAYKIEKIKSIINSIKQFVEKYMLEDVEIISRYYSDYFEKGISYPNFMSYGVFDEFSDPEITYVKPGVMISEIKYPLQTENITQGVKYAWYEGDENNNIVNISKPNAYTFIKAPRLNGLPMEVGPLARMMLTGEYTRGRSCMDRNIARVLEAIKIAGILEKLAERIQIKINNINNYDIPENTFGVGLIDTTRGALGHFIQIENKVIKNYKIITPTAWNLSPKDNLGVHGAMEKALLGLKINNLEQPVEIGRVIRSYDPCVSCATHLISNKHEMLKVEFKV